METLVAEYTATEITTFLRESRLPKITFLDPANDFQTVQELRERGSDLWTYNHRVLMMIHGCVIVCPVAFSLEVNYYENDYVSEVKISALGNLKIDDEYEVEPNRALIREMEYVIHNALK